MLEPRGRLARAPLESEIDYFLELTITNYLFRQNRTRNITKVILITHTKISTLQRSCQGDCT